MPCSEKNRYFAAMTQYFQIGKLAASFGLKGELILQHELGKKTSLKGLKAIFIETRKEEFLPYFLESARIKSETELYVKLEGVDTKEAAMRLLQKSVWLTAADFQQFTAKKSVISILGYRMLHGKEDLGEILEVIEQPMQLLCRLEIKGREVLIPLHEETIQSISHTKKQVKVLLPDGLLDIYLQ